MSKFPEHYVALMTEDELRELEAIEAMLVEVDIIRTRLMTRLRVRAHRQRKKA